MSQIYQIAIDGPSGAGKSTVAKKLAEALNIDYIDTGAMYRAVGYKILKDGIDLRDKETLKSMLKNTHIDFRQGETILDGVNISGFIRSPEVTRMASDASALPEVREILVNLQRSMGKRKSVVLDGRDIGTNVFPKAKYKFYLTASVEERAQRRWAELSEKGQKIDFKMVKKEIAARDYNDSTRILNPLRKAEDALEIDTTGIGVQDVISAIMDKIKL